MVKPIIGLTMHAVHTPFLRSALNQHYVEAVVAAGGAPLCIPLGLDTDTLDRLYGLIDGLLLSGGDDVHPARYGHEPHPKLGNVDEARDDLEFACCARALADDLPTLGICRGIQVMAVSAGGTLYQDIPSEWESDLFHDVREFGRDHLSHTVTIQSGTRLAQTLGVLEPRVNSFHHQAVRDVPAGFVVSAYSPDGIVEAIESSMHRFAVGVQCHPEAIWQSVAPEFGGLFQAFVESARGVAENRRTAA